MAIRLPIYLDNHATTRVDPRVFEAMTPYFLEKYGNAASRNHCFGWEAERAVEDARKQVASLIGAAPEEIVFTSGATESNNLAIKGAARMYRERGNHIITAVTEHKSVLDSCKRLEKEGFQVTYLPVDSAGLVHAEDVRRAITSQTLLVTLMSANNEIGVLHPIAEIGRVCKERGVLFHSDAAQAVAKVPFDVGQMRLDLVSFTAHKIYGPKGIGALYVRSRNPRVQLVPLLDGGGQEQGIRSGTLPVPNIVGLAKACEIAQTEMPEEAERIASLRDRLKHGIFSRLDGVYLNGHPTERLPGNLNLSFADVDGEALLMGLSDIAISSGSACATASQEASHVLRALACAESPHTVIRFGIGRFNTEEEVDYAAERVCELVAQLRELSSGCEMAGQGTAPAGQPAGQ